jgi:CheY-like chemotaxis protein
MKSLKRILLVEDESDIQQIASIAMEEVGGFTVEVCGLGREAVERASLSGPDLILLDVMMPDMDGTAVLKSLKKNPLTSSIPVIFMTARVQPHEVSRYKEMGVLSVIPKPFDPMTLPDTIKTIWREYYE